MNYNEALGFIHKAQGIRPGLDTMNTLLEAMDSPHKRLKAIHIAGTNGKGSVGAFINEGLIAAGYNTGRYSSPAIFEPRDILSYNNVPISQSDFAEAVFAVQKACKATGASPTPFEIETAAAFYWLDKMHCDFAVIEAGMGGRLDATNTVDKIMAVITPIALDHQAFLGNTLEEIAQEKAGIIKDLCISAPQLDSVRDILERKSSKIIFAGKPQNIVYEKNRTLFDYKDIKNISIPLLGKNQTDNAALAIEVLKHLGIEFKNETSFMNTIWRCRFERLWDRPSVFADGAHNPHGAYSLAENIKLYKKEGSLALVTGVLADKDYGKMAEIMGPLADKVYTVTPNSPRALDAEILSSRYSQYCSSEPLKSIEAALDKALDHDMVVVFGTFTIMKDVYEYFRGDGMYNSVLNNLKFKRAMSEIERLEKNRKFCRHSIEHSLDVARIAYIISLEKGLDISKDIIYTAALLHDIGRSQKDGEHNVNSANMAEEIMTECGYSTESIRLVSEAILCHRDKSSSAESLRDILGIADKASRLCWSCEVEEECRWKAENKNRYIVY